MQLESSLFGIVIIQIKPQIEKLLNLPYDSLTKEIQLYQDIMKLFIYYQIPADLLSYNEQINPVSNNYYIESNNTQGYKHLNYSLYYYYSFSY